MINANEELVQSLAHYEKALKPVEQDSDSDTWSVSDSDGDSPKQKRVPRQKRMSTGGSGRNTVAKDLAEQLRTTSLSQNLPPPKPPRPVKESPPAKPPRPPPPSMNARLFLPVFN